MRDAVMREARTSLCDFVDQDGCGAGVSNGYADER